MVTLGDRVDHISPSATLALTAKAKQLKSQGYPVISLAAGEPDFAMPSVAQDAVRKAVEKDFTKYTPTTGTSELKEAIRRKLKRDQNLDVAQDQIAVSCGAKHSLYNIIQVVCSQGDEVIIPRPYWVSYPEMVKLAGARVVEADTSGHDFLMTAEVIEKHISPHTKLIILNSPSNPTGAVLRKEHLQEIADLVIKRELFLITDEIYEYYVFDGIKHVSLANLVPNFVDHVAIVNGVSKSYAMTGLRIGYSVARADLIKKIGILQDHSTSNPASLSQMAALSALGLGEDYQRGLRKAFEAKRDLIIRSLEGTRELKVFRPAGAFYAFVSVKGTGLSPETFSNRLLQEKYVAVVPGEGFGSKECVRMSFAAATADIEEGCRRIREWVKNL